MGSLFPILAFCRMNEIERFIDGASQLTNEDSMDLIGWEPSTIEVDRSEAESLFQIYKQFRSNGTEVKLVRCENQKLSIWEKSPPHPDWPELKDLWPVEEHRKRTRKRK